MLFIVAQGGSRRDAHQRSAGQVVMREVLFKAARVR